MPAKGGPSTHGHTPPSRRGGGRRRGDRPGRGVAGRQPGADRGGGRPHPRSGCHPRGRRHAGPGDRTALRRTGTPRPGAGRRGPVPGVRRRTGAGDRAVLRLPRLRHPRGGRRRRRPRRTTRTAPVPAFSRTGQPVAHRTGVSPVRAHAGAVGDRRHVRRGRPPGGRPPTGHRPAGGGRAGRCGGAPGACGGDHRDELVAGVGDRSQRGHRPPVVAEERDAERADHAWEDTRARTRSRGSTAQGSERCTSNSRS